MRADRWLHRATGGGRQRCGPLRASPLNRLIRMSTELPTKQPAPLQIVFPLAVDGGESQIRYITRSHQMTQLESPFPARSCLMTNGYTRGSIHHKGLTRERQTGGRDKQTWAGRGEGGSESQRPARGRARCALGPAVVGGGTPGQARGQASFLHNKPSHV